MANNHQGSVEHAKLIVDKFASLAKDLNIKAAIKFQFRQLDTFIHEDYKQSDLKFVKRFNSTRLSKSQFREIIEHAKSSGLNIISTPFDNESIPWLSDLGVDIIKVASCSSDDWPLLKDLAKINKKIIISTGGADLQHLQKVYDLFKKNQRDFAFMHCVGEYPTPNTAADMSRISRMQEKFPDIEIGFSTHESPLEKSLAPAAAALGCTIIEKHVGVETDQIKLNGYSNTPTQLRAQIEEVEYVLQAMQGKSKIQNDTLKTLKRGVYFNRDMKAGEVVSISDLYFALPVQPGQADASMVDSEWGWVKRKDNIVGRTLRSDVPAKSAALIDNLSHNFIEKEVLDRIRFNVKEITSKAGVTITERDSIEISCHYGIDNFDKTGAVIIDKVNREFCKKIIVMFPGQHHPTHRHILKEEAFELLYGDCVLELGGKKITLEKGVPKLIPRKINHSFETQGGCVIEEISTTHHKGDSVYVDVNINKLELKDRKIKIII